MFQRVYSSWGVNALQLTPVSAIVVPAWGAASLLLRLVMMLVMMVMMVFVAVVVVMVMVGMLVLSVAAVMMVGVSVVMVMMVVMGLVFGLGRGLVHAVLGKVVGSRGRLVFLAEFDDEDPQHEHEEEEEEQRGDDDHLHLVLPDDAELVVGRALRGVGRHPCTGACSVTPLVFSQTV